ncbi:MAG: hypothetical protein KGZ35_06950 [Truepera sp.]|nr:hypothetical protein [Truepera sp.]
MRWLLLLLCLSWSLAAQEVVAPRVRVIYHDPALADYAQRVAHTAERALTVLEGLFAHTTPVVITLDASTDVFNAFAPPLPRPTVALRVLFPLYGELSYRDPDPLFTLLLHELTHSVQLTYTEGGTGLLPDVGLVGSQLASVPPSWFLEGIATWVESEYGGGRLDDALSRGLIETVALEGDFPTLAEAGLITYEQWPGGLTRYLFGAAFIDYLVERHGFEAILATLQRYNRRGPLLSFADAWERAVGPRLEPDWAAWQQEVTEHAQARAQHRIEGERRTDDGGYTRAPAMSPDGLRLAWVAAEGAIVVAEVSGSELGEPRVVIRDRAPQRLAWLDDDTLIYARVVPRPGTAFSELFALEITSGLERQLTAGARAHHPAVTPEGCILFVRDVIPARAELRRWCDGATETVWQAPAGSHIVGLAVSPGGQVALSLWRQGMVDLALLEGDALRFLTQDSAQNLDPAWDGEGALLFRSDRDETGAFDLYRLELDRLALYRLTRTLGGAFSPVAAGDYLWHVALGGRGYDLAVIRPQLSPVAGVIEPLPLDGVAPAAYPVRPYDPQPSLAPYGWLPTGLAVGLSPPRLAAELTVFGQDDSGLHSYALRLGLDTALVGPLGSAYGYLRYDYGANTILNAFGRQHPLSLGLQAGVWPHRPHLAPTTETAFGVAAAVMATLPNDRWLSRLSLELGPVYLPSTGRWQLDGRAEAIVSNQRADWWGYRTRGLRLGATAVHSGASLGAWAEASYLQPLAGGTLELALTAGYRPALPIPLTPESVMALASLGHRLSLITAWRYDDGLYALERLTFTPRLRGWLAGGFYLGADLTVMADLVINYGAPLSVGVAGGYAEGFWLSLVSRLPL